MAAEVVTGIVSETVTNVTSKAVESAYDVIRRHISYVFKHQSYMDVLEKQVQDLKNARQMVEEPVKQAERQGKEIYDAVKQWLVDVSKFTEDVSNLIIGDEEEAKKRCFKGLCPNLIKRYTLSKKADKALKDGAALLGKRNFPPVSYCPALQWTTSMYNRGYKGFASRESYLQRVIEALKVADSKIINVWGMGGVGKSTLVKKVAAQVIEDKLFDTVIMCEVAKPMDRKQIQSEIASKLGLTLGPESLSNGAIRIRRRLIREKRVLVILDDLCGELDLEDVGIFVRDFEEGSEHRKEESEGMNDNLRGKSDSKPPGSFIGGFEEGSEHRKEESEGMNDNLRGKSDSKPPGSFIGGFKEASGRQKEEQEEEKENLQKFAETLENIQKAVEFLGISGGDFKEGSDQQRKNKKEVTIKRKNKEE